MTRPIHQRLLTIAVLVLGCSSFASAAESQLSQQPDRSHWPAALRNVPIERLSSGALLRLDAGGDLVETPAAHEQRTAPIAAALSAPEGLGSGDPRVGPNVRLGDDPPALPSTQRAQAEPHIVRAAANHSYLLATFQEGRYAQGGSAVNCGYSVSRDGGITWSRALIPGLTPSSGGPYPRATDPVAGVALNGQAYLNTLAAGSSTQGGTILVSRSFDGTNFNPPRVAFQAATPSDFPDKNWMAINTFAGTATFGRIVVTFTMFPAVGSGPHPIMRVYSDDGGETWSPAALIHSGANQVQGSQPVFLPDGRLAVVYWNFNGTATNADDFIELVVSNDGGVTFGSPRLITPVQIYNHPTVRDGAFLPSVTTDRATGTLHVAYQELRNGQPRIMFTRSHDAGVTWTQPVAISDNPAGSGVFNAAISASPDGQRMAVAFYDTRDNPGSQTLVDLYVAMSFDGGNTWQPNVRVSTVSTNAALAPLTPVAGYMLGDYQAIAEAANASVPAVPVWIDTRTGDSDPFTARVTVVPPGYGKTDFNVDGSSDLLWWNRSTGDLYLWLMNATQYGSGAYIGRVSDTAWQARGSGDFNRDGKTDVVWWNQNTGGIYLWLIDQTQPSGGVYVGQIPAGWETVSTGDFNGDTHIDLLLWNRQTGDVFVWLLNGGQYSAGAYVGRVADTAWEVRSAGDFDRDGKTDVVWWNRETGDCYLWLLNGTQYRSGVYIARTHPTTWELAGAGDFNRDGDVDLVWWNRQTGDSYLWLMNATQISSGVYVGRVDDTAWEVRSR